MALPTALRRGGAMVIDASGPSLLVLFVVGGFAWVAAKDCGSSSQRRCSGAMAATLAGRWRSAGAWEGTFWFIVG
eukprot:4954176-Ditylum_brightwellii.AAC.1